MPVKISKQRFKATARRKSEYLKVFATITGKTIDETTKWFRTVATRAKRGKHPYFDKPIRRHNKKLLNQRRITQLLIMDQGLEPFNKHRFHVDPSEVELYVS